MVVGLNNRILKLKNDSNLPIPLQEMPHLNTQQSRFINTDTKLSKCTKLNLGTKTEFDVLSIKVLHLYDTPSNPPYKTHILNMHFSEITISTYKHTT